LIFFLVKDIFVLEFDFLDIGNLAVSYDFLFDGLTILMVFVIVFISFLVHLYSIGYMYHDPFFIRFITFLTLFTFFMLLFVVSGNLLLAYFGWEGVGLSSFLLINFWFNKETAYKSAVKAMFTNKIGDCAFVCFISSLFNEFGTFNYLDLINFLLTGFG